MQQLNINELKPHPRNNEFFDDMTGDAWEAFKESIKTSGIIEPIVVTKDMIIVSGHQRVRAAKELGISTVMVDIRKYENDEQVLKDLIETNIRQRGVGNPNPIKLGRCIKELEKIYGVREGRPEKLPPGKHGGYHPKIPGRPDAGGRKGSPDHRAEAGGRQSRKARRDGLQHAERLQGRILH